jgi:hypothetical protein
MKELIQSLATEIGTTAEALRKWRERGKVPLAKRFELYRLAESKGISLHERDFEFLPSKGSTLRKRGRAA